LHAQDSKQWTFLLGEITDLAQTYVLGLCVCYHELIPGIFQHRCGVLSLRKSFHLLGLILALIFADANVHMVRNLCFPAHDD
jgi:hypothetical protein